MQTLEEYIRLLAVSYTVHYINMRKDAQKLSYS